MTVIPGFLLKKIPDREKFTAQCAAEIKIHLCAFSLISICQEVFRLITKDVYALDRNLFILSAILFFLFFCILDHVFNLFVRSGASTLLSLLPAIPLFFLLQDMTALSYPGAAVIAAAAARVLLVFVPHREALLQYGIFPLDAAAVFLYFSEHAFNGSYVSDRLLFICLVVMTLSSLQKLIVEKNRDAFPFGYFILIGAILLVLPMGREPLDWSPVLKTGETLINKVMDITDNVAYFMSSFSDNDSYSTGYGALNSTGEQAVGSERTQLILKTTESPYYLYQDSKTGQTMKIRRTIYLAGGRGADGEQLVSFLKLMRTHNADSTYAALFSRISKVSVQYAYLHTADEIAPAHSILLYADDRKIESGVSSSRHKKGYQIDALYLDIDYGSPYLTGLFREAENSLPGDDLTYEDACAEMKDLYGVDFGKMMGPQEYEAILAAEQDGSYTDTTGTDSRMKDLMRELTADARSDYDKCRLIEKYLRQYTYDMNTVGGHDPKSDMSTAKGMADIADRFLFETKTGYCVHYTSSMVMLLRLAGIPARAAAGYRYVYPFDRQDSYEVSGINAHVWPEAYLKNVGWVPFEPTASMMTQAAYTWHKKVRDEAVAEPEDPDPLPVPSPLPATAPVEEPSAWSAATVLKIAWPMLLAIAVLLAALIAGAAAFSYLRYRYGTPEKKLKMDVELIKKRILRKSADGFTDRGLLSDYVDRAPFELRSDIRRVFDAYYRSVYGNDDAAGISPEENALAASVRDRLR